VTFSYLDQIPERAKLRERLMKLWNFERYGIPFKQGERYFYSKNDGLQNQSVLYVADSLDAAPRVLLDPNKLSSDGTVALSGYRLSEDGNLMAYGLSTSGSDWNEWKVRDVRTGADTGDHIKWVKFSSASWTKDGKGFFYSRYDAPKAGDALKGVNKFQKLYFHKLGTPQSDDVLIYERRDQPDWGFGGSVTDDGRFLIISIWQGTDPRNRVYYRDLTKVEAPIVKLLDEYDADYSFVDNDGGVFWFYTDLKAPRGRVIAIDTANPDRVQWKEVIPQAAETLKGVNLVGNQFICTYLKDARGQVKRFSREGPEGRARTGETLQPRGAGLGRSRLARTRQRGRLRRQAHGHGDFLLVHQLHDARHHLSLRRHERHEQHLPHAAGGLRLRALRDQASLLQQQGRHACADVPNAPERPEA